MTRILNSFKAFMMEILSESMLAIICCVPFLAGLIFKWVLPNLAVKFLVIEMVDPYYIYLDLLLVLMTPYMFCFASSMVILSEIDNHIVDHLYVTPLGKNGYFISRLVLPSIIGSVLTVLVVLIFAHTDFGAIKMIVILGLSGLLAILLSMMVITLAGNRAEGIAIAKFAGIILMGIFVPRFVDQSIQFLFYLLPTYWIGLYGITSESCNVVIALVSLVIWLYLAYGKFDKKLG